MKAPEGLLPFTVIDKTEHYGQPGFDIESADKSVVEYCLPLDVAEWIAHACNTYHDQQKYVKLLQGQIANVVIELEDVECCIAGGERIGEITRRLLEVAKDLRGEVQG